MDLLESEVADIPSKGKHPAQLYLLFFTEMWERFSFYGMKGLLIAYMVTQLKFDEPMSYGILGSYAALVYTMPMLGGMMADRFLGYQRSIIFGGIMMAIGHLVLAIPQEWSFFAGMAFIICGNGYFKPNISSLVGTLYSADDPRKDAGFSLFYMGINVGALMGGTLCTYVGRHINWHYGFGLAGIFMILGLVIFMLGKKSFKGRGLSPVPQLLKQASPIWIRNEYLIYIGTLGLVPVIIFLFRNYAFMDPIMFVLGVVAFFYVLYLAFRENREVRNKLLAALLLIISTVLFWAFYEQNSGSMNLFAIRNVNMHIAGVELDGLSVNNFLPPGWVVVLSFFFAWLWPWLNKRRMEPSTPVKFGYSFLFLGIGFYVLYYACGGNMSTGLIGLTPFVMAYFFVIAGELCISPISLSMVTKLSPRKTVSMMMGILFFASAVGEYLASKIGSLMSVPENVVNNAVLSMPYYSKIFMYIGGISAGAGILLVALSPLIRRLMGDVR